MNREHMMGHAPIAERAADFDDTGGFLLTWSNPYALGLPNRVRGRYRFDPAPDPFETINHALPDGCVMHTDAQLARRAAENATRKPGPGGSVTYKALCSEPVALSPFLGGKRHTDPRIENAIAEMGAKLTAQAQTPGLSALVAEGCTKWYPVLEEVDADLRASLLPT